MWISIVKYRQMTQQWCDAFRCIVNIAIRGKYYDKSVQSFQHQMCEFFIGQEWWFPILMNLMDAGSHCHVCVTVGNKIEKCMNSIAIYVKLMALCAKKTSFTMNVCVKRMFLWYSIRLVYLYPNNIHSKFVHFLCVHKCHFFS